MDSHIYNRIHFTSLVMRQFPIQWVTNFQAYEALAFYGLEDFIDMTSRNRMPEQSREIMKICIRASEPEDDRLGNNTPYGVLDALKRINTRYALFPIARQYIVKFDREMYFLARSNECHDSERILEMFCTRPARIIQYAWKKYQKRKRDQASRIIQEYVRNWLYRPGGPMMKKAETSFYTIASKQ